MKSALNIKRPRLYLFLGVIFLLLMTLSYVSEYADTILERTVNNVWRLPYVIALHYTIFEFAFPFIGRKRRTILLNILIAIPIAFAYCVLYSYGLFAWRLLGIGIGIYTPFPTSSTNLLNDQMAFSMMSLFFFGIGRHIYLHAQLRQMTQKLRIEKQEAELNYLKSQTNPHFLFNTLNNIYSLARDKSDLAPESILRLSKILRYMLYETAGHYTSIEQELKIISDYIELEKLRYDDSLQINFYHHVEDTKQAVPPLLLIPLVENAFKHGVSETRERPYIDLHLTIKNRQLVFVVKNPAETHNEEMVKENIGLSNLRRQLELLYGGHSLNIEQKNGAFTAELKINLLTHVKN